MSTGLFQDEEDGYNLEEETKYKLKLDAPSSEPAFGDSGGDEDLGDLEDFGGDDGGDDEKPFDDEPFDAGIETSEAEDPEKFIQQLSGKLGTSLRKYSDERGQPDFDLEKFAVNSVISATHTSEMSEEDQEDIIKKVKTSGAADDEVSVDDNDIEADGEGMDDFEGLGGDLEGDDGLGETIDMLRESEYQGKDVELNKPSRGDVKKFKVFVKNDKGNVVKVNFGDPNMEIKRDNPDRKKAFRARHNCDNPGPKWKARYWSCKMWSSTPVSKMTEGEDMFIQNLKNIKSDTDKMLSMDRATIQKKLKNADWVKDHISTSTDDTDEVSNYLTNEAKGPCWKGYEQIGMKDKGGKQVPNCVPVSEGSELGQDVKSSHDIEVEKEYEAKTGKKNLRAYIPKPGLDESVDQVAVTELIEVIGILSAKLSNNYQDEEGIIDKVKSYILDRPKLAAWALKSDVIDTAINMMTNQPGESLEMDDLILKVLYKLESGISNDSGSFELNELSNLYNSKKNAIFTENMNIMDYIKNKIKEVVDNEVEPTTKPTITPVETPSPRRKRIWEPNPLVAPKPKASK